MIKRTGSPHKFDRIAHNLLASALACAVTFMAPFAVSAQDASGIEAAKLKGRPYSPFADRAFPTDVYFGDTHVHTSISADAGGGGTRQKWERLYEACQIKGDSETHPRSL